MSTKLEKAQATAELVNLIHDAIEHVLEPIERDECPTVVGLALAYHVGVGLAYVAEEHGVDSARQWLTNILSTIARHPDVTDVLSIKIQSEVRAAD